MASRTPPADAGPDIAAPESYLAGWAAARRLIEEGNSWSGHERHCAYLNDGAGAFVDVSSVTGLDLAEDGRAAAATDWDGDGDVDLWLRHRTSPQLRLMRNDRPRRGGALWLRLRGTTVNRDAVGARVEVTVAGERRVRVVTAGDGYLVQSTRWLHVGTGDAARLDSVVVRWPGGAAERIALESPSGRFEIVEGSGRAVPVPPPPGPAALEPGPLAPDGVDPAVLLRVPLPLPAPLREGVVQPGRPVWIAAWAEWCEPCLAELRDLAAAGDALGAAGLDVVALALDRGAAGDEARAWFEDEIAGGPVRLVTASDEQVEWLGRTLRHVTGLPRDGLPLPLGLLVDGEGRLQLLRLGRAPAHAVAEAARRWTGPDAPRGAFRGLHGGRWYFRARRDTVWLEDAAPAN